MSNSTGIQVTPENQAELLELVKQAEAEAAGGKPPEQKSEESKQPEGEAKAESKSDTPETKTDEKQDDKAKGLEIEKPAEPDPSTTKFTMESIAQEFEANNGKLTDETNEKLVKALEAAGLDEPQAWIAQFLEGRQVVGEVTRSQLLAGVGGEDGFKAMATWAKENVSAEDLAAYNNAVKSRDTSMAKLAVEGMHARFQAASKTIRSNRIEAGANTNPGGVEPVFTTQQVAELTSDPRYDRDPAWRAQADRRIQAGIDAAKRR